MVEMNFEDVCRIAEYVGEAIRAIQDDGILLEKKDVCIHLSVSEPDLHLIDRQLFNVTASDRGEENQHFVAADKVETTIMGIKFEITKKE